MDNRPVQLEKHPVREFYQQNSKTMNAFLMCVLVFILGEIVIGAVMGTHGTFLSVSQVFLTIRLAAFVALFGLCQQLVICVGGGGLDLSVGYIATLTGICAGHIMNGQNGGILLSILAALAIGGFFGLCNGLLTAYLKLPSLVVTMAMANIVQGIVNAYVSKVAIEGNAAPALQWLAAALQLRSVCDQWPFCLNTALHPAWNTYAPSSSLLPNLHTHTHSLTPAKHIRKHFLGTSRAQRDILPSRRPSAQAPCLWLVVVGWRFLPLEGQRESAQQPGSCLSWCSTAIKRNWFEVSACTSLRLS